MRSCEPQGIVRGTKRIIPVMCRDTGLGLHGDGEAGLESLDLARNTADNAPGRVTRIEFGAVDSRMDRAFAQFLRGAEFQYLSGLCLIRWRTIASFVARGLGATTIRIDVPFCSAEVRDR